MFSVEWLGHKVALKASNGKYICTKKNGQLLAVSDAAGMKINVGEVLQNVSSPFHLCFLCQVRMNCSL